MSPWGHAPAAWAEWEEVSGNASGCWIPGIGSRPARDSTHRARATPHPTGTVTAMAAAATLESLEHSRALAITHLIRFFISSHHAHSLDEGVAGIVHTCLDALV